MADSDLKRLSKHYNDHLAIRKTDKLISELREMRKQLKWFFL